jgi:mono/diheme cytochrome c family protein
MMTPGRARVMRSACALAGGLALVAACESPSSAPTASIRYLDDTAYRRAELVASIVDPDNGYSKLRLAHYASGTADDWDLLPEWNPPTEAISASELDAPGGAKGEAFIATPAALTLPEGVIREDDPVLLALGRAAFSRYPVQLAPYLSVGLASREAADQYGLWTDATRGVGGLVRARMGDGSTALAMTCSSCHAAPNASSLEDGRPNALFDPGAAILESPSAPVDSAVAAAIAAWGPGRLDVTTTSGTYPARIPDLRPVRWLTYLHQEGTLRQNDLTSLAIRIETLVITSNGEVLRPPRVIALALAAYLTSLARGLPSVSDAAAAEPRGAQLFASRCASCHALPGLTGDPVPLAIIGTDPWLGDSPDRGTGAYRVPSLHGVGSRGALLHDGTVPSIDAMLDPSRPTASFAGRLHGSGAVPGHLFGLDLPDEDRAALVAYVKTL